MSLINDALQRAKQQTVPATPASGLQLRPVEPAQEQHRKSGILLTVVFVAVLMLAGALMPMFLGEHGPDVAVSTAPVQPVKPVAPPNEVPVIPQIQIPAAGPAATVASSEPAVAVKAEPVAAVTPVSEPPPLKLNGIFFHTARPSAIINGKTVYVGSRVGESRVDSISQSHVTLVRGAETNVLSFEE